MKIEISLETYKKLVSMYISEEDSPESVILKLLNKENQSKLKFCSPWIHGNVSLPHGTRLRAFKKGITYYAEIRDGKIWESSRNTSHTTLSPALFTQLPDDQKHAVNGWTAWQAEIDGQWFTLDDLRQNKI